MDHRLDASNLQRDWAVRRLKGCSEGCRERLRNVLGRNARHCFHGDGTDGRVDGHVTHAGDRSAHVRRDRTRVCVRGLAREGESMQGRKDGCQCRHGRCQQTRFCGESGRMGSQRAARDVPSRTWPASTCSDLARSLGVEIENDDRGCRVERRAVQGRTKRGLDALHPGLRRLTTVAFKIGVARATDRRQRGEEERLCARVADATVLLSKDHVRTQSRKRTSPPKAPQRPPPARTQPFWQARAKCNGPS